MMGILGEYIGRIYEEVKRRPLLRDLRAAQLPSGGGKSARVFPPHRPGRTNDMTGPLIPKGAEGADPGEELAAAPAGETAAAPHRRRRASPPVAAPDRRCPPAVAARSRRSFRPAARTARSPARAPACTAPSAARRPGAGADVLARALGVLALVRLVGRRGRRRVDDQGQHRAVPAQQLLRQHRPHVPARGHGAARGRRGSGGADLLPQDPRARRRRAPVPGREARIADRAGRVPAVSVPLAHLERPRLHVPVHGRDLQPCARARR